MARKITATKITMILYSEKRKAVAPSWIEAAISFIFSLPAGCFLTLRARKRANSRPTTLTTGTA